MKVQNSIRSISSGTVRESATRPQAQQVNKSPNGSDKVALSSLASSLLKSEGLIAESDAFDSQRVDEIRQAIKDGRFVVDPERVASSLISNVREMLGAA